MQAALERSRGSRDQIFLELELQVGPCLLRVSFASLDGRRLKGPILPVCTLNPILQAARDEAVVLIGLVQWWRLQSSGRRMDCFAFGTCCQWTQCSCRNENKKERPAGSGFLIGTILPLALQPS